MLNAFEKDTPVIIVDGPDKVGKKTQTELLAKNLVEKFGKSVFLLEVPVHNCLHKKIYEMLDNGQAVSHPEMFQTFQFANRMIWQDSQLDHVLSHHDVVIFDRWNVSSWVYGRASGLSDDFLQVCGSDIIQPDFHYIFDGEPFPTPERADDSYEKNKAFRAKVRENYQIWAKENPEVCKVIDANRPVEIIEEEILTDFLSRFPEIGQ